MRILIAVILVACMAMNSFSQKREYVVSTKDNSKLKSPDNNLKAGEFKVTDDIQKKIDGEIAYHVAELKKSNEDFPEKPEFKKDRMIYKTAEGLIVIQQTTYVDYEYTEISVFVIIDKEKNYIYSRSDILGEFITLSSLKKKGNAYMLCGNLKGNPKAVYSGDFCWSFDGAKRNLEFVTKKK
jgi:hypothetical protein